MKRYLVGTTEAARILGISRIAVFKKIQKGQLEATKIGRNYVIDRRNLENVSVKSDAPKHRVLEKPGRTVETVSTTKPGREKMKVKKDVEDAVGRAMREFREALRKMGVE